MITDIFPFRTRTGRAAAASVFALALTACTQSVTDTGTAGSPAQIDRSADAVVATVNDTPIYRSDVRRAAIASGQIGEDETLDLGSPVFKVTIDEMIDQRLLSLDAERTGVASDAEARRRLDMARERIVGNYRVETYLDDVVTDDTVFELYQAQRSMAGQGEERRIRQIVVDDAATAATVAQRLRDEESFEALVEEFSTDEATRDREGERGWVSRDMLDGTLRAAVFNAELGGWAGPIEVDGEHVLVEVLDTRTPSNRSFEEVRDEITRFMTFRAVEELMTRLREDGEVERLYEDMENEPAGEETLDGSAETEDSP